MLQEKIIIYNCNKKNIAKYLIAMLKLLNYKHLLNFFLKVKSDKPLTIKLKQIKIANLGKFKSSYKPCTIIRKTSLSLFKIFQTPNSKKNNFQMSK